MDRLHKIVSSNNLRNLYVNQMGMKKNNKTRTILEYLQKKKHKYTDFFFNLKFRFLFKCQ